MSEVLELTAELIRRRSVTPDDAGCQALIAERLARIGFHVERLPFGDVQNLWATHGAGPTLAFLGHTDVVPSGPEGHWASPPFEPTIRGGCLHGRGAADMKSGVAAMVVALEAFVAAHPAHAGRIGLLLTSDEEGAQNLDGIRRVAETFRQRGERIDWCLVGEPSSRQRLGDLIRVGRRGSLSGSLRVHGIQGHVAYPELARNPIHALAPALAELAAEHWDDGNADFPPTSFQVSNIAAGTGAGNVIPGELTAEFNFRYSTASTADTLRARTEAILGRHGVAFELAWNLSGEPFLSPAGGRLREAVVAVCREHVGAEPEQSTGGGTSDGRFIAPLGVEVVELGPCNATIHKVDERIALDELERLPGLYLAIAERILIDGAGETPVGRPYAANGSASHIKRWTFRPERVGGHGVAASVYVPVCYQLEGSVTATPTCPQWSPPDGHRSIDAAAGLVSLDPAAKLRDDVIGRML